jgi:hypothetical protein
MRRSIDAARDALATLDDRDAILDCFFEHSKRLFDFTVLFVLRGDSAHGRNVHGLGAPDGLVKSLVLPTNRPGVLARVRELRRPFVTASTGGEVDSQLFGTLGRMMPLGLAIPLVVRSRVVAVVLCDGPAEILQKKAKEANRQPVELAKEEMLLWAESVSEALEKLILRLKGSSGSVPPPRQSGQTNRPPPYIPPPSALPAGLFAGVPAGAHGASDDKPPPSFRDGEIVAPEIQQITEFRAPVDDGMDMPAPSARGQSRPNAMGAVIAVVSAALVIAGGVAIGAAVLARSAPGTKIVVAGPKLPGFPSVDPLGVLDPARKAAGLGDGAKLLSIEAEVTRGGRVDFAAPAIKGDVTLLTYHFATDTDEAIVRVDKAGLHGPSSQPRTKCGDRPCGAALGPPKCTFAQIWQAATGAGLADGDRAVMKYADAQSLPDRPNPEWLVSVEGRGELRLDVETCKPLPRNKLRPAPLALASVPGAPRDIDATAVVTLARTQSGLDADSVLLEIDARGVGAKGRIDLSKQGNEIVYTFADPPGAAGTRRWRQVSVGLTEMNVTGDENGRAPSPATQGASPPPPLCTIAKAREYLTLGSTAGDADAHITYGADTVSQQAGQWWIDVPSTGLRKRVTDNECDAFSRMRKN